MSADLLIDADPPCYQSARELAALVALYRARRPARVLEVGTYYGGTLRHWLAADWRPAVVSVDLPAIPPPIGRWQAWAAASGATLTTLTGSSHDPQVIGRAGALGPYDWILIDADHTYAAVKADWETYRAMAAPGAIVALHDINPRPDGYGVDRLWAEIRASGARCLEINAGLPGLCGLGLVFVD